MRYFGEKVILVGAAIAVATTVGERANAAELEEITVTAQKRTENLQDVPISVAVHTGAQLKRLGISQIFDLVDVTPGLVVNQGGSNANPYIRGIGSTTGTIGNENSVATYVDGTYIADRKAANLYSFLDIERIEVLKGPQGTLFGRNATGGAINIITKAPTQEFSAELEATVADHDETRVRAYLSGGLSENLTASLAISHKEMDGYINNVNPASGFSDADVGGKESDAARLKLLWHASDAVDVSFSAEYIDALTHASTAWQPVSAVPNLAEALGIPLSRTPHDHAGDSLPIVSTETKGANLTIDWSTDRFDIKSITSYREAENVSFVDIDISPAPIFTFGVSPDLTDSFQQEVHVASNNDSGFRWIVGAFYLDDNAEYPNLQFLGGIPYPFTPANVAASAGAFATLNNSRNIESLAVFGEGSFDLTDNTSLTIGIRQTEEDVTLDPDRTIRVTVPNANLTGFDFLPGPSFTPQSESYSEPTWSVVLDHQFRDDVMGYVSYKRGFKSGVYNLTSVGGPNDIPTQPELVDAYEVGIKSTLLDQTLRINAAMFYYDYTELQVAVTRITPAGAAQTTENAAEAEIFGLDASIEWIATDNLSFFIGASFLDTEYTNYPEATVFIPAPAGQQESTADLSGYQLPYAADFSINIGVDYEIGLNNNSQILLSANWNHTGEYNLVPIVNLDQEAFDRVNVSATWTSPEDRFYVKLWGTNVLDEDIIASVSSNNFGQIGVYAAPATYGLTAGLRF